MNFNMLLIVWVDCQKENTRTKKHYVMSKKNMCSYVSLSLRPHIAKWWVVHLKGRCQCNVSVINWASSVIHSLRLQACCGRDITICTDGFKPAAVDVSVEVHLVRLIASLTSGDELKIYIQQLLVSWDTVHTHIIQCDSPWSYWTQCNSMQCDLKCSFGKN